MPQMFAALTIVAFFFYF
ncbi:hypothetical protein Goshw_027650 [Gossypium schwendimanii]|uniref:Uncharacterized protein n=1 Tax=Gossypium schwendimanii TaxID=34291 RepID=A0A7J9MEI2_GOSSC|nr:hypothetical protein [Gossypium schwendimanii]